MKDSESVMSIDSSGTKVWRDSVGLCHREDGPALVDSTIQNKKWYIHGKLHREDGPAVLWGNLAELWYQHNELHRIDGPAITANDGTEEWYKNGVRHRIGGPAVIKDPHNPVKDCYYIEGKKYTKEAYMEYMEILRITNEGNQEAALNLDI